VGPVHFEIFEVLEEMDDGNDGIGHIGDQNDLVAALFRAVLGIPQAKDGNAEDEEGREPDQPVGLQLLGGAFELLMSEMPLEVDQAASDLAPEPADKRPKNSVPRLSLLCNHETSQGASDTVMYPNAVTYANGEPVTTVKRLTRAEKQAATRAALLKSAAVVFTRRGYDAATVDEITEAAGFSRGAFYSNYGSKEELFLSLIESRISGRLGDIAAAFQEGDSPRERITAGGRYLDSLVAQDRQWCLLYMEFWGRAVREPKLRRRFAAQYEVWRSGIAEIIETQSAELGVTLDAPSRELASALIALFEGHVLQKLIDPTGFEEGLFTRLLLRFFARFTPDLKAASG